MSIYKQISGGSVQFEKKLVPLDTTNLGGSSLKFTKADRTDLNGSFLGNLFTSFNLPVTVNQKQDFTTGKYAETAFQYLNQDKIIIIEIPKNSYGEMVDGKTISLSIPTTAGTVNVYSTFFKNSIIDTAGHLIYSDPNQQSSEFGQSYNNQELPGQSGLINALSGYSSNVAYLFSDSIQKPENNSNYSWATSGNYFRTEKNLPTGVIGNKFAANYSSSDGSTVDIPVGIVYLDKGFIVITNPTIVNNFNYSIAKNSDGTSYTGNTNFTNIYFTTGSSLSFQSFNTEFVQHAVCIALPNEFYQSNNPTFTEAYGLDNLDNNPVAITEIGLYNANYDLICIAKVNKPIAKTKSSVLSFDISIRV
jgi:hypothetical protein